MTVIVPQAAPNGKTVKTKYRVTVTHDGMTLNVTYYDMAQSAHNAITAHNDYAGLIKIESDYRRTYLATHDGRNNAPTGSYVRITMERITTETDGPIVNVKEEVLSSYFFTDNPTDYEKSLGAALVKTRTGGQGA